MQNIKIETVQNVVIEQTPANIGERIAAYFIDVLILFSYYFIVLTTGSSFGNEKTGSMFLVIMLIPFFFYNLLCEIFMNGQSFGKKALKIKVVKIDGSQPSIGNYIIRWLFRIIDISFFYGIPAIITIAANGKGQRIGDIVAKTTVITLKKTKKIEQTIYEKVEDDYSAVYPEAENLSDSDINTVKEVLKHYKKDPSNAIAISMIKQTEKAIAKKTGITHNQTPAEFLETIVKDYNSIYKQK